MSNSDEIPETVAAATVIPIRDGEDGLEVLVLRRNPELTFAPGAWVFPGGRVDVGDDSATSGGEDAPARHAAVREAAEEAGLVLRPDALVPYAHWTPPLRTGRRFATWFFLTEAPGTDVVVDGEEIVDHLWGRPAELLERHAADEMTILPPTWVTLAGLSGHPDVASAIAEATCRRVPRFVVRLVEVDDVVVAYLYEGDAGYEDRDLHRPGPRHRLSTGDRPWRYERD